MKYAKLVTLLAAAVLVFTATTSPVAGAQSGPCIPDFGIDDTLYKTHCCSGQAIPGTTWCLEEEDEGNGWATCYHICAPSED